MPTSPTTIFVARHFRTMNPGHPLATAVAVRDGHILGVGAFDELKGWGPYTLDTTFQERVLVPGFIEAHAHVQEGALWTFPYVGYFDRLAPVAIKDIPVWGTVLGGRPFKAAKRVNAQQRES